MARNSIFKVPKGKKQTKSSQPEILYPRLIFFKTKGKILFRL